LQHWKFDGVVPVFCLICIQRLCFSWKSRGLKSCDHSGQFCRPPQPILRSGNCSFRYSTCWLKSGLPCLAGSTSVIVFCVEDSWMTLMFYIRFRSSWNPNTCSSITSENQTYIYMTFLTGNDLGNKILKYWHVTGHCIICILITWCIHDTNVFMLWWWNGPLKDMSGCINSGTFLNTSTKV
jgi:hypothetical protein